MYAHFQDFDDHALVTARYDASSGLSAIVAVHNENLGPAIGGCRILPYVDQAAAITDVLRLSRGMSYKSAIAGIPYGGGKAVIIADPKVQKTERLLHAMGDFVESLGGRYITSFDSGTTLADVRTIGERTSYVGGTLAAAGDASERTAAGIFYCIQAAVEMSGGVHNLEGIRVSIQGVGNVGRRLAARVKASGGLPILADQNEELAARVAADLGALHVPADKILECEADVFSPCTLGAILSEHTIPLLKTKIVVGGANNQLATAQDDQRLKGAGILYCPDYLANAGGIIDLHYQRSGWTSDAVEAHVRSLADTFRAVVERSSKGNLGTAAVADRIAKESFRNPRKAA